MKRTKSEVAELRQLYFDKAKEGLARLSSDIAQPDEATVNAAIAGCLNSRTGAWRKTLPKEDPARLLWTLVKWHRSGGSLWGYPHFADPTEKDQLDTLALVLLGGQSSAVSAWERVLT